MPKKKSVKGVKESVRKRIKEQDRKKREKIRYTVVRNVTGNAKLAQRARGWSEKKLFLELDIVLPEKLPRLKPLPKEKKQRLRNLQDAKFNYAISKGLDIEQANFLRTKTYRQIDKDVLYKRKYSEKKIKLKSKEYYDKYEEWKELSKDDDLPPELVRQARLINLQKGIDLSSKYGFAVMFYQWTRGNKPEYWAKELDWDRVNELVIYRGVEGKR